MKRRQNVLIILFVIAVMAVYIKILRLPVFSKLVNNL